jgi:uncharacterized membrane protein YphA (DoxX/SURF4 family)
VDFRVPRLGHPIQHFPRSRTSQRRHLLRGTTEFFGGIAIGVGLFGRLAALALISEMVMAMITVTFKHGLESSGLGQGYEINIALLALAAVVVALGTGRYSVDAFIGRTMKNRHHARI